MSLLQENTKSIATCKNCSQPVPKKFCSNCGQSITVRDVNHKFIVGEIHDTIFRVNNSFLLTLKELFTRPGAMIADYIDGKRIKYFRPISYLLLLVAIYTTLEHKLNRKTFLEEILLEFKDNLFDGKYSNSNIYKIINWMINNGGYTFLLIIPLISFATYLAFIPAKKNYFKHLILNTYINAQIIIIYIFFTIILFLFNDHIDLKYITIINDLTALVFSSYVYYLFFTQIKPYKRILFIILSNIYLLLIITITILFIANFI